MRACDVILYELFSHHALHLCAHWPHGITGTFRERDWNISVCIYTSIVYCDWTVEFQLKGSRGMMSDYLFSRFETFFFFLTTLTSQFCCETLSVWLTVHFVLCLSCVSLDHSFRNVYNWLLTSITLKNVWFHVWHIYLVIQLGFNNCFHQADERRPQWKAMLVFWQGSEFSQQSCPQTH